MILVKLEVEHYIQTGKNSVHDVINYTVSNDVNTKVIWAIVHKFDYIVKNPLIGYINDITQVCYQTSYVNGRRPYMQRYQ